MNKITFVAIFCLFAFNLCAQDSQQGKQKASFHMILKDQWEMQSALKDNTPGGQLSQSDYTTNNWHKVTVPTTIIAGLLANKYYDFDPFFGENFKKLEDPSLDKPWWFRKVFKLPATEKGKNLILKLHGINYKADVWLNGKKIANSEQIKGPMRIIQLDITGQVNFDGANVLALQITRPFRPNRQDGDLAIDYADWIHYPPDYNAGIINDVELFAYNQVGIQNPLVTTKFDLPSLKVAHLSVDALVTNYTGKTLDVTVVGAINDQVNFEQKVHLLPHEKKNITFSNSKYPQLNIKDPKIWWPWQYGKQEMNSIQLSVTNNGKTGNRISEQFGIRQVTSEMIDNKSRVFLVNGKRILLRGAAWSPDIFQRRSAERQEQEIRLYRDMNLNIIRSEGKFEDDHFYKLCDQYGMLVMTGWMCCGAWQYPANWSKAERQVAMASDSSMMYWLRNKASILTWLNGSDMPPKDVTVERDYLKIEKGLKFPNPILATANEMKSKVSGNSGVKMAGPYEWVPPIYWETDSKDQYGGPWSFATEISPGPSIPPYESLIKFLPKDQLWYDSDAWKYHCGTMKFGTTDVFNTALINRYGKPADIQNYVTKAQAQNYEAHRAMMEAYGLHKYQTATGVIQWMGANPWPSLIWHTFDYYLYPAGTYFGIKKAMEPLHVLYSYAQKEVALVNSLLEPFEGLKVTAAIFDQDGSEKWSQSKTVNIGADKSQNCFSVPKLSEVSNLYFLRLQLEDQTGKTRSINWYWLSKKPDVLNWEKSNWWMTPQSSYTDYTGLQSLENTTLDVKDQTSQSGDSTHHTLTLTNTGKTVAFQVHVRALNQENGADILPVIFNDNYLELAPGESREIVCSFADKDREGDQEQMEVSAWNLNVSGSQKTGAIQLKDAL